MSAPTTEAAAAQPAVVADATPVDNKHEETVAKTEESTKKEESTDVKVKQEEAASKTEKPAADVTMEDVKPETDGEVKKEEADSKPAPLLKTKAPLKKDTSNKKFDPSVLPQTDDPNEIRNQFEFYFGDTNLPSDKHMWNITGGTENKPVKVKHILNFGRCKRFQPYEAVISALKESQHLDVSGSEGDEEVKRKHAYVPAAESAQKRLAASVYVKGFGDETPTTQIDIETFFKAYGPVNAIRLRRTDDTQYFKGSVFVEFPSEEAAKAFVALDPAPTYQGHELKIMSKKAYIDEKNQLIKEGKLEPKQSRAKKFWEGKETSGGRGRGGGGRGGGDRNTDSNDWKKRRDNDQRNGNNGGRGGRGGRGRGRGGRGRGGDRNGRDGGRDNRRRDDAAPASNNNVQKPRIQTSAPGDELKKDSGKRAREDDGAATSEPAAKKVDTKAVATAPAERND